MRLIDLIRLWRPTLYEFPLVLEMYLFCCYADVVMYFANEFYCFYCAQYGLLKKTWMWEMVFVPNAVWFIVVFLFNVTTLNWLNFGLNVEAYRINFMNGCAFNAYLWKNVYYWLLLIVLFCHSRVFSKWPEHPIRLWAWEVRLNLLNPPRSRYDFTDNVTNGV